eukprot:CAMPEP_0180705148 /NCGR_PEP_ID=MMETSP1038_2-20121128/7525_1 /TAXON_ID=632150 /ORGANISM="Azadinium spinosum, Strain 3D9" /LENGTH=36 /DNA_ID= /DNA_START= /DNA_END= /DNA_ORIENTATION=
MTSLGEKLLFLDHVESDKHANDRSDGCPLQHSLLWR